MYYNNSSASDNQNSSGVWDSDYEVVLHLNQTSGNFLDSTVNNNDGVPEGTVTSMIAGPVGRFCDFDAGTGRVAINATIGSIVTVSTWGKLDTQGDMLWCLNASDSGPDLWFSGDEVLLNTWDGSGNPFGSQPTNVNAWHLYTTVIKAGDTKLFIDGVFFATADFKGPSSSIIYIGSSNNDYTWDGSVDEFRVSNVRRSDDWIKAQYLSMTDSFVTFGIAEE